LRGEWPHLEFSTQLLVPRDSHARNFRYFEAAVSGLGVFTQPEDKAAKPATATDYLQLSALLESGHPGRSPVRVPLCLSGSAGDKPGQARGRVMPRGKVLSRVTLWCRWWVVVAVVRVGLYLAPYKFPGRYVEAMGLKRALYGG
jgi:hypothetical protein